MGAARAVVDFGAACFGVVVCGGVRVIGGCRGARAKGSFSGAVIVGFGAGFGTGFGTGFGACFGAAAAAG
jgi:hypothetical protein